MSSFSKRYFEDMKVEERLRPNKKGYKKVYVYCGDWYVWDMPKKELNMMKLVFAIFWLASFVIYIVCSLQHVSFNYSTLVAVPTVITLFPMCYAAIGVFKFCFSKEKMMKIDFEEKNKKLKFGSIVSAVFVLITAVTGFIVMLYFKTTDLWSLMVLVGLLFSAAFSFTNFFIHKKLKFKTLENKNAE